MEEYKASPWGIIPTHWKISSIKEETDVVTDYVANGSFASLAENVKYKSEKDYAVLIRLVDYNNQFKGDFVYIDKNAYEFLGKSKLYGDEIIISNVGANVGTVFRCPHLECKMSLAPNSIMVKFNGNNDFYYYWLKSRWGQHMLQSIVTGSAQPKFNKTNFRDLQIPVPPLDEQISIAAILKSLDDKIEVNRRINVNLEQQAQALFKSWFVDFEPFKNGEFVESELGMIPKGWRVVSLGNLMSYNGGSQPPASEFIEEYKEGYIRFIQIRDYASDGHITYIPVSKRNKLCDVKDIMIARYGASLGRICYGLKGAYNVALAKVSPLKEYYREYLRCFLNTREFYEGINNKGNRAVQAGFNQSDIQSFRLPFPTDEYIVKSFDNLCSYYFERRLLSDQESRRLAEIRDTLLPKLMSGELKVTNMDLVNEMLEKGIR